MVPCSLSIFVLEIPPCVTCRPCQGGSERAPLGAAGRWCFLRCALSETEMRGTFPILWGKTWYAIPWNLRQPVFDAIVKPGDAELAKTVQTVPDKLCGSFLRNCTTVVAELERAVKHRACVHVDRLSPQWGLILAKCFPGGFVSRNDLPMISKNGATNGNGD